MVLAKDRHVSQWKGTENPEKEPKKCAQFIFDTKEIKWKKDKFFNKCIMNLNVKL